LENVEQTANQHGEVDMRNDWFRLNEEHSTVRAEVTAGVTTFLTMAYVIVVQPAVLSGVMFGFSTGMDFGAAMFATCVSAAATTLLMGLYARYPIALAPGMGASFFFVLSALPAAASLSAVQNGATTAWQVALGVVFISGILFVLISLTPLREQLMNAMSPSMKNGIAAGIGMFIAFIGLQNAGVIVKDPSTAVKLNAQLRSPDLLVFFVGLITTSALQARRVRSALLWGIAMATITALGLRWAIPRFAPEWWSLDVVQKSRLVSQFMLPNRKNPAWQWFVSVPPSPRPLLFKMDIRTALTTWNMLSLVIIFLYMDVFDTIGTLVAISEQAGFLRNNRLPRARQAMLTDAVGTVLGACLGTSTVTSYIESAAGVSVGGRTGLTSVITAVLFLMALLFSPLARMLGSYAAITAPALVVVGGLMMRSASKIVWEDASEAIPSLVVMLGIPLSYSIGDGLALGFITYPLVKLLSGRSREVSWLMYILTAVLIAYFVFVRARLA
jgi:AGZA family xanthine/uracil permease-like MFS transporter